MKRVKLMLLSLTLVAVVGGALAFKAKSGQRFCTTFAQQFSPGGAYTCVDPNPAPGVIATLTCPTLLQGSTTGGSTGNYVCTTTEPAIGGCGAAPICLTPTELTKVENP